MAVQAYFSGVESKQHFDHCVRAGVKHVLMSYLQFYQGDLDLVKERKLQHPEMKFMVDSGAFTFITSHEKYQSWTRKDYEDYVRGYVDWLKKNRKYVTIAVEYDIDYTLSVNLGGSPNSSIGTTMVSAWQQSYFRPLVESGMDVIFVWHENRGPDGWEDMCRRYAHVGMPGHFSSEPDVMNRHIGIARRYGTRIHGFAATKQIDFRDVPWFTVDSITWKTGEMYGNLIVWDERQQRLIFEDDKTQRFKYKQIIEEAGFDSAAIIGDTNYREVTAFGLWSMRRMELFYENRYKDRPFYYEIRLPHWRSVARKSDRWSNRMWRKLRGPELFDKHSGASAARRRELLCAVSAAQSGDLQYVASSGVAKQFLGTYFPKLIEPLVTDASVLQKEIVAFLIPPNPKPLVRDSVDHFEPRFVPRARPVDASADETEFNYFDPDLVAGV